MASGDTLLIFTPLSNEPPNSNYATLDLRNNHPVLDFIDSTYRKAFFTSVLPRSYTGGGLTIIIWFAMSSANNGNVLWKTAIERIAEVLNIEADGFAGYVAQIQAVAGTSGIVAKAEIEFTDGAAMDNLEAGELFRFEVRRDGGEGSDTASGDAELLAVEIKET